MPWLKLASFGDTKSEKNSLRHDVNVPVNGIEADYDREQLAMEDAERRLTLGRYQRHRLYISIAL